MKKLNSALLLSSLMTFVTGCSTNVAGVANNGYQANTLSGPGITENLTRYTSGLACVSDSINIARKVKITVDQIPDKSGKVNSTEGYKVTQGVESMAITALTNIDAISVVERRNIASFNLEAELMKEKRIGDGKTYKVSGNRKINYKPMLSGKIKSADYYITGAITEVNYNIHSGGKLLNVSGLEFGKRTVRMSVAMDLRIVNVHTLEIIDSITLQKQFIGERTKAGLYRFLDSELVNFDGGSSTDEPLQLGVRSLVERGVAQLVGRLFQVDVNQCYNDGIRIR